jgi:hypothetical protein
LGDLLVVCLGPAFILFFVLRQRDADDDLEKWLILRASLADFCTILGISFPLGVLYLVSRQWLGVRSGGRSVSMLTSMTVSVFVLAGILFSFELGGLTIHRRHAERTRTTVDLKALAEACEQLANASKAEGRVIEPKDEELPNIIRELHPLYVGASQDFVRVWLSIGLDHCGYELQKLPEKQAWGLFWYGDGDPYDLLVEIPDSRLSGK